MYVKTKSLRVLGVIGAVLLCIPLVLMLLVTPVYSAVSSLITPNTLTDIIRDVDYTELMPDVGDEGMPAELLQDVVNTPFMEDVIAVYTDELAAVMSGEATGEALNADTLAALIDTHADELVELMRTYQPEDTQAVSDEELRAALKQAAAEYSEVLTTSLPTAEDVAQMMPVGGSVNPLALMVDPSVTVSLIVTLLVLAALTFVCLLHRFRALLWLGIETAVAALLLLTVNAALGTIAPQLAGSVSPSMANAVLGALSANLTTGIVILLVVSVLLIGGFIAWRVWDKRRQAAPEPEMSIDEIPAE